MFSIQKNDHFLPKGDACSSDKSFLQRKPLSRLYLTIHAVDRTVKSTCRCHVTYIFAYYSYIFAYYSYIFAYYSFLKKLTYYSKRNSRIMCTSLHTTTHTSSSPTQTDTLGTTNCVVPYKNYYFIIRILSVYIQHARDRKSLIWSSTILVVSLITVKGMNTISICVG